jgi:hypothetical protein
MTPFCRGLKNIWSGPKNTKTIEKVRGSQDDDFVGVLKKHPKRVGAYGLTSWAILRNSQASLRDCVWKGDSYGDRKALRA